MARTQQSTFEKRIDSLERDEGSMMEMYTDSYNENGIQYIADGWHNESTIIKEELFISDLSNCSDQVLIKNSSNDKKVIYVTFENGNNPFEYERKIYLKQATNESEEKAIIEYDADDENSKECNNNNIHDGFTEINNDIKQISDDYDIEKEEEKFSLQNCTKDIAFENEKNRAPELRILLRRVNLDSKTKKERNENCATGEKSLPPKTPELVNEIDNPINAPKAVDDIKIDAVTKKEKRNPVSASSAPATSSSSSSSAAPSVAKRAAPSAPTPSAAPKISRRSRRRRTSPTSASNPIPTPTIDSYSCDECACSYRLRQHLVYHIRNKHSSGLDAQGCVECDNCGMPIKGVLSLRKHLAVCMAPAHLYCRFCPLRTKHKHSLRLHLLGSHGAEVRPDEVDGLVEKIVRRGKRMIERGLIKASPAKEENESSPKMKMLASMHNLLLYCANCAETRKRLCRRNPQCCPNCSGPFQHQCAVCGARYTSHGSAKSHFHSKCARRHASQLFRCDECGYATGNKSQLRIHVRGRHIAVAHEDFAECRTCGKGFKLYANMRQHEKMCGKGASLRCGLCPYRAKYKRTLDLHVATHGRHAAVHQQQQQQQQGVAGRAGGGAGGDNGNLVKKRSNTSTVSPTVVQPIAETDENEISGIKKSSKKSRKTVIRIAMNVEEKSKTRHLAQAHCKTCDRAETGVIDRSNSNCPHCHQPYSSYHCLGAECPPNKSYASLKSLQHHLRREHIVNGQRAMSLEHRCSNCGKGFLFHDYMRDHERHCQRGPHLQCPRCDYRSKWPSCMQQHRRKYHPEDDHAGVGGGGAGDGADGGADGEGDAADSAGNNKSRKRHACAKCQKQFDTETGLRIHESRYCGREPRYRCAHCSYKSYSRSALMAHLALKQLLG